MKLAAVFLSCLTLWSVDAIAAPGKFPEGVPISVPSMPGQPTFPARVREAMSLMETKQIRVQYGELMQFRTRGAAERFVAQQVQGTFLPADAASTTEDHSETWWIIKVADSEDLYWFFLRVKNVVTPKLNGVLYEITETQCKQPHSSSTDLFLVAPLSPALLVHDEVVYVGTLSLPRNHVLRGEGVTVCGTVIGVF